MKKEEEEILKLSNSGEFIYRHIGDDIPCKYKPDTPLISPAISYVVILCCLICDTAIFYSFFDQIGGTADPVETKIQCGALLLGFDVSPVYLGIVLKKKKQGFENNKLLICISLICSLLAVVVNTTMRILTMNIMGAETDVRLIATTIFSLAVPLITSSLSFSVSSLSYNPLVTMKKRYEKMIAKKTDEIRRLQAILSEYELNDCYYETLVETDNGKFEETNRFQKALLLTYCCYVRQRLKEHIATPSGIDALSGDNNQVILEKINSELKDIWKDEGVA